jgi:hypothetical protein
MWNFPDFYVNNYCSLWYLNTYVLTYMICEGERVVRLPLTLKQLTDELKMFMIYILTLSEIWLVLFLAFAILIVYIKYLYWKGLSPQYNIMTALD